MSGMDLNIFMGVLLFELMVRLRGTREGVAGGMGLAAHSNKIPRLSQFTGTF